MFHTDETMSLQASKTACLEPRGEVRIDEQDLGSTDRSSLQVVDKTQPASPVHNMNCRWVSGRPVSLHTTVHWLSHSTATSKLSRALNESHGRLY